MDIIAGFVARLPEVYQQIYGHPEFDGKSSRSDSSRETAILEVVKMFQKHLGRKTLRVLDIGCAQGYFCFKAAELGCVTTGIDFCAENVACCQSLQQENGASAEFYKATLTLEYAESLALDSYDVVLLLNVVHHIAHDKGFEHARVILETLAKKIPLIIAEIALRDEPVYWAGSLPEQYASWFDKIAFFHERAFIPTHLSDVRRPLLVASNHTVVTRNEFLPIDEFRKKSFEGGQDVGLRYYFHENTLVKYYRGGKDTSYAAELAREHEHLLDPLSFYPKLMLWEEDATSVLASYEIRKGRVLWDVMKEGGAYDTADIAVAVLDNLIELEQRGLYHNDIRSWNVVLGPDDRAVLIDIGSISDRNLDFQSEVLFRDARVGFPITTQRAFVSLVYDLLMCNTYPEISIYSTHVLSLFYDTSRVSPEYAHFFQAFLLAGPEADTFVQIRQLFKEAVVQKQALKTTAPERARLAMLGEINRFYEYQKRREFQRLDFHSANAERYAQIQKAQAFCEELDHAMDRLQQSDPENVAGSEALQHTIREYGHNLEAIVDKCAQISQTLLTQEGDTRAVAERVAFLSSENERRVTVIQALESANQDRIAHIKSIGETNQARDAVSQAHDEVIRALESANQDRIAHIKSIDTANQVRDVAVNALGKRTDTLELRYRAQEATSAELKADIGKLHDVLDELRNSQTELKQGVDALRQVLSSNVRRTAMVASLTSKTTWGCRRERAKALLRLAQSVLAGK